MPKTTRLKPTSGKRGALVTITGGGFGTKRGSSFVKFGAKKCTKYVSWGYETIKCRVPAKAKYGVVKVTVRTAAGTSNSKKFTVKRVASLGTPKAPTTVGAGKTFTVWGYLKPRFPAGQKTVKVRLYRYKSGKWSYVRTCSAKNSNYSSYSKYKARIRLTSKAKYRFKSYTSTTTTWAGTSTGYGRTTTVR